MWKFVPLNRVHVTNSTAGAAFGFAAARWLTGLLPATSFIMKKVVPDCCWKTAAQKTPLSYFHHSNAKRIGQGACIFFGNVLAVPLSLPGFSRFPAQAAGLTIKEISSC
jgi:hypothetical protein